MRSTRYVQVECPVCGAMVRIMGDHEIPELCPDCRVPLSEEGPQRLGRCRRGGGRGLGELRRPEKRDRPDVRDADLTARSEPLSLWAHASRF